MPIWSIWQFPRGTPEGTQDPNGVGFRLFWRPRFIRSSGTAASILASRDRGRSRCRHPASEGPLRSGQYRGESPRSPRPHGQRAPSGGDLPDVRQAGTQEASFPSPPPRSSRATCRAVEPRVPPRDRRILASGPRSGRTTHEAGRIPGPGGSNAPACRPSPGTSYSPSSDSARERAVLGRSQLLPLLPYPVLTAPRHHPRSLVKPTLGMSLVLELMAASKLTTLSGRLPVGWQSTKKCRKVYIHVRVYIPRGIRRIRGPRRFDASPDRGDARGGRAPPARARGSRGHLDGYKALGARWLRTTVKWNEGQTHRSGSFVRSRGR